MSTADKAPRMNAVWDSCGDYEKPHRFAKRVFDVGVALEIENAKLREALATTPAQAPAELPATGEALTDARIAHLNKAADALKSVGWYYEDLTELRAIIAALKGGAA